MAHGVLQINCETKILPPIWMLKTARIAADKQHYLTCAHALFGRCRLICHGIGAQRVTVQVNYDFYARILGEVFLDGLTASVIRACVARVVEHLRVVNDIQAAVLKHLRKFRADAYNIEVLVERPVCSEVVVFVQPGRGVGLARMRMHNKDLRLIRFKPYWAACAQYRVNVDIIAGGVFYGHTTGYGCRYDSRRCRSGALRRRFRRGRSFGRANSLLCDICKGDRVFNQSAAVCAQV